MWVRVPHPPPRFGRDLRKSPLIDHGAMNNNFTTNFLSYLFVCGKLKKMEQRDGIATLKKLLPQKVLCFFVYGELKKAVVLEWLGFLKSGVIIPDRVMFVMLRRRTADF